MAPSSPNNEAARTCDWNRALPYDVSTHELEFLAEIKEGLAASALAGDYAAGCYHWARRLNVFLSLKYQLPAVERMHLAKLLYDLMVLPELSSDLVEQFADIAAKLIKKKYILKADCGLQFEWKPLWDIIRRTSFPHRRERVLPASVGHLVAVINFVKQARRFFPPSATKEILEEFVPDLNPHNADHVRNILMQLSLFMPVGGPPPPAPDGITGVPPFYWVPTLFSVWSFVKGAATKPLIDLLSRLAKAQVGSPWNVGWTEEQVSEVFTTVGRGFDLPIGSGSNGSALAARGGRGGPAKMDSSEKSRIKSFARFIVYTIYAEEQIDEHSTSRRPPRLHSLKRLETFIQSAEGYFHPSNNGAWSFKLAILIESLSLEFLKRWNKEHDASCKTPTACRLTPGVKSTFVNVLKGVSLQALFGKDPRAISSANFALKYLGILEPGVIFPALLEKIYPSLETLTQTHRTLASISNLSLIILPMLNRSEFPSGGLHLLRLLSLSLPGIDMNDPMKTQATFFFITMALMTVPLKDLSQLPNASNDMVVDDTEIEDETRLTTAGFEEWILSFLAKVFSMLENLPEGHGAVDSKKNSFENSIIEIALHTCEILFNQMPREMLTVAVERLTSFLSQNVVTNGTKAFGYIVRVAGGMFPSIKLQSLLTLCTSRISDEIENGAASKPGTQHSSHAFGMASTSDATLHWYQCILFNMLNGTGLSILEHQKQLSESIHQQIKFCKSYRGVKWAGKVLRNTLSALTSVYPLDGSSFSTIGIENISTRSWGSFDSAHTFTVQWHVPSAAEYEFAFELITTVWSDIQKQLGLIVEGQDSQIDRKATSLEIVRWLILLQNIIYGISAVLPPSAVSGGEAVTPSHNLAMPKGDPSNCEAGYLSEKNPLFPKFRAIRSGIERTLVDVGRFLLRSQEDEIIAMKQFAKAVRIFISDRGTKQSRVAGVLNGYKYAKTFASRFTDDKTLPRHILVKRMLGIHLNRLRYSFSNVPLTTSTLELLDILTNLSISPYAEIRKVAQSALAHSVMPFHSEKAAVAQKLFAKLLAEEVPEHVVKGSFYLVRKSGFSEVILKDGLLTSSLMNVFCKSYGDKPSIQELVRKSFVEFVEKFSGFSIYSRACEVKYPHAIPLASIEAARIIAQKRNDDAKTMLKDTVSSLLRSLSSGLHWRLSAMAINLIELVWKDSDPVPVELAAFFMKGATTEHPIIRAGSTALGIKILRYMKMRAKTAGSGANRTSQLKRNVDSPVQSSHDYLMRSAAADYWTADDLHDSVIVGWLAWPAKLKLYRFNTENGSDSAPFKDDESSEATSLILRTISNQEFWLSIEKIHSQEASSGKESFNTALSDFVRCLAGQFEDRFVNSGLRASIERLSEATSDKSKQRSAAELLGGLLRGSKHWPTDKLKELWTWVTPLLSNVLPSATPDSLGFWAECINYVSANRDPRRIRPIIDLIFGWRIDPSPQSYFTETKKMIYAKVLINALNWRLAPWSQALLDDLIANIRHPYKQVRETIGGLLDDALGLSWYPSARSVNEIMARSVLKEPSGSLEPFNVPIAPFDGPAGTKVLNVFAAMKEWRSQEQVNGLESSDYGNASKTVLSWLISSLVRPDSSSTFAFLLTNIEELYHMTLFDDVDLQASATAVSSILPMSNLPPALLTPVMEKLLSFVRGDSSDISLSNWHVKVKVLPAVQVLYFYHLNLMSEALRSRVLDTVAGALIDPQIEVRQLASVTLSGLIRCSERKSIADLKAKFSKTLRQTAAAKKKTASGKAGSNSSSPAASPGQPSTLVKRHSAVLGLSALVLAFPYDIPEWMPDALMLLSSCTADQAPVSTTTAKTFAEFKRTHQDGWQEHLDSFTDDQRAILRDVLVSASYYA
ncbi:hypothetical protein DFJ73DRAFT_858866 [Zopfochytrium polystomum]|nr:hypothetical protein DFJ73DRAFT_858866 [Zopfochytrium polystomum]